MVSLTIFQRPAYYRKEFLNPTKSGYLYNLPEQPAYNLYGVGYENTSYFGSFMPDNLQLLWR